MEVTAGNHNLSKDEIMKLKQFHAAHFPNQEIPDISASTPADSTDLFSADVQDDDGLGYYDDGAKRTLTDEQIKMFRHSEIQRLLSAKRRDVELMDEARSSTERGNQNFVPKKERKARDELQNIPDATTSSNGTRGKHTHFDDPVKGATDDMLLDYGG